MQELGEVSSATLKRGTATVRALVAGGSCGQSRSSWDEPRRSTGISIVVPRRPPGKPKPGPDFDAHHLLSWKHAPEFAAVGLDVNNAECGVWIKGAIHRKRTDFHDRITKRWDVFWLERAGRDSVTRKEVLDEMFKIKHELVDAAPGVFPEGS